MGDIRDGIDVVTVVTEAPLSYSGVLVKIDSNTYIGEEGAGIYYEGKIVGMVTMEEYGSKMLAIGGVNKLTGKNGFVVARTIVKLSNGEAVELSVNNKIKLVLQAGKAPVINGNIEKRMRIGCGSATIGLFADRLKNLADE